jgi:hypothetical protein
MMIAAVSTLAVFGGGAGLLVVGTLSIPFFVGVI